MNGLDALLVAATPSEGDGLRGRLSSPFETAVGGRPLVVGGVAGLRVGLLVTGLGKVNASLTLGAALERCRQALPRLLLSFGAGGAYPGAGLGLGDLAVATEEAYADEGVETPAGFRDLREIGIPLWEAEGGPLYNRFPAEPGVVAGLCEAARRLGRRVGAGPFATVSAVTGSEERARGLETAWGAVCESMEGAALAHGAAVYGIPFGEVRGISNPVGARDRAAWRLAEAAAAAREAVLEFLKAFQPPGGLG